MSKPGDLTIDSDLVRTLASLLAETGLSEIEYAVGDRRIRVARGGTAAVVTTAAAPAAAVAAPAPAAEHPGTIKAPMVGTAYLAAQPGTPPFVKTGDAVAEGQVILIIEAMKVMNQIRSPKAGRLARILVEDGAPVEFGQALMVLE